MTGAGGHSENAITQTMELEFDGVKRAVRVLIDSGAELNFISQKIIAEKGLSATYSSIKAHAVDGHDVQIFGEHDILLHATDVRGACYSQKQSFLAATIRDFDVILGMPWLRAADPEIRFKEGVWFHRFERPVRIEEISAAKLMRIARKEQIGVIRLAAVCQQRISIRTTGQPVKLQGGGDLASVLPQAYDEYTDVFSELDAANMPFETLIRHTIPIEEGKDVAYGPIYALSAEELRVLREYLDKYLARGWIRKSESPAGAPILFVPKKDGGLRLCVDYRALNKVTIKNRHPLPLIGETLDRLSGAAVYTKFDLRDAYHRIPIAEKDIWKTAFRTRYGHFEYAVMPFGLTNAPATFQAYINEALGDLLDVICVAYLDDILIFSKTEEEHAKHVRMVLERLRQYKLYVKLSKCAFSVKEVDFLGFIVNIRGTKMDPSRVKAIHEWVRPKSYHDIQVFLGFTNFYRGFIQHYSKVAAPISDLLKGMEKGRKTGEFIWTAEAEQAYVALKNCFSDEVILTHYDPERQCKVETDASGRALGGIMSQAYPSPNGRTIWRPVAFFSRKMQGPELNYGTPDQEMLAIVECFKEWRHYLEAPAIPTLVLTDHQNLRSFMTTKDLNRRQARWAEALSTFSFNIEYRKGKENPADGLSRRPDYMGQTEEVGNPLWDLLRTRIPGASDELQESTSGVRSIRIRALTREMTKKPVHPAESDYNTLPQVARNDQAYYQPDTLKEGRRPIRGRKPSARPRKEDPSQHAQSERRASSPLDGDLDDSESDNEDDAVTDVPRILGKIPDALTSEMLALQSIDNFCKKQPWRTFPDGRIPAGRWKGTWHTDPAGLVRNAGAVYVPEDLTIRSEILRVNHDDPWQGGHFGRSRTQKVIKRFYYWPELARDVRKYVSTCDICQRMKSPRHKPYGLLMPIPVPEGPWTDISLDFVTGLPPSARRGTAYDALLVVVDRFSKMIRLVPCGIDIAAEELGEILVEEIFSKYGLPKSIISDRGPILTSEYWGTMCYHLAVKRRLTTAFHPQTDGQTERMNQTVESYLRCYVNYFQDDWVLLLPSAEYACNQNENATTGRSPFEAVYRFTPTMRRNLAGEPPARESHAAIRKSEALKEADSEATNLWREAQKAWSKHYNSKHKAKTYKIGEKILLSTKNLRLRRASKKLADKFVGPFEVLKAVGQNAYSLKLPKKYGRLHNTFHVSLLEPFNMRPGSEVPAPIDIDGDEEWEVERILDMVPTKFGRKYLVRWKGFSEASDTWEPAEHLLNAGTAIESFLKLRGL